MATTSVDQVTRPPVLEEYGQLDLELTDGQVEQLRRVAGRAVRFNRSDLPGRWTVQAGSTVGTLSVPGVRILIRPKVEAANLFHLLGVSTTVTTRLADPFAYEHQPDLVEAIAPLYVGMAEQALARGLVREYEQERERLPAIRGRIDLAQHVRAAGLPIPVACIFDEHTPDTQINRLVKAAAIALLDLDLSPRMRARLRLLCDRLDEVGALHPTDRSTPSRFTRLNQHMEALDRLARLILDGASLTDEAGAYGACSFLVDMNRLFEEFVETRLRSELRGAMDVTGQRGVGLDADGRVGMRPDLVFSGRRRVRFVGDAKYKLTASGLGRDRDYYQLLAYCTALNLDEGVLVYCRDDGDVPPQEVRVRHTGVVLHTWPVTLSGMPADIDAEFAKLADWIRRRAERGA